LIPCARQKSAAKFSRFAVNRFNRTITAGYPSFAIARASTAAEKRLLGADGTAFAKIGGDTASWRIYQLEKQI
jgi:hypothetical protein